MYIQSDKLACDCNLKSEAGVFQIHCNRERRTYFLKITIQINFK